MSTPDRNDRSRSRLRPRTFRPGSSFTADKTRPGLSTNSARLRERLDRLIRGDSGASLDGSGRKPNPRPIYPPRPRPGGGFNSDGGFRDPEFGAAPRSSLGDYGFRAPGVIPGGDGPGDGGDGPVGGGHDDTDHSGGHHGGSGHHGGGHHGHHRNHFHDHRRHHHHHFLRFCFCYGHYCPYYRRHSRFYGYYSYYTPVRYWYRYCYVPYYYPYYYGLYGSYYDDYGPLADPSYGAYDLLGYGGGWATFASGAYSGGGGGGAYPSELLLPSRAEAWSLLGEGRIEAAQEMFGLIVLQMPYEGEARIGFALTTALLGDGERAIALMRQALVDDPEALYDVPLDDPVREKLELLLEAYGALVRADLANTDSLLMVAVLRFILEDYPGAFFAVDAAIKAGDQDESAANLHALLRAIMFESF